MRKKDCYFQAQFQRSRHRRGPQKAICAVAVSMLTEIYHMLIDNAVYKDLGADHFHRSSPEAHARRLAKQVVKLGFTRTIAPAQQAEAVCI